MKRNNEVVALIETSIFVGIAVVLDIIFGAIYSFPFGGSIGVAMLPIFIISSRRGLKYGVVAGVMYGLIQTAIKVYFLSVPQYLMDYIVTFAVVGLSGLIPNTLKSSTRFGLAILLGSFLRLISASLTGIFYWKAFIPDELGYMDTLFHSNLVGTLSENMIVVVGSFLYNSLYMIPSAILCVIVGVILHKRQIVQFHLDPVKK